MPQMQQPNSINDKTLKTMPILICFVVVVVKMRIIDIQEACVSVAVIYAINSKPIIFYFTPRNHIISL